MIDGVKPGGSAYIACVERPTSTSCVSPWCASKHGVYNNRSWVVFVTPQVISTLCSVHTAPTYLGKEVE